MTKIVFDFFIPQKIKVVPPKKGMVIMTAYTRLINN